MNNFKFLILFLIFSFFIFDFCPVLGAEIILDVPAEVAVNQQFKVDVFINTQGEAINAVEGLITFQRDFLEVKEFSDGDSIINFWLQKPKLTLNDQISFSGITPGGYNRNQGKIFSITFQSLKEGETGLNFSSLKILLNDGSGAAAQTETTEMKIKITGTSEPPSAPAQKIDNELPETFTPEIGNDPNIFEGQWFLVFAAQDKGSGIDHYEVKEGWGKFTVAESPYLLKNQNLDEKISVKAVDKNGNERMMVLPPKNPRWYKNYLIVAIIMLIAGLAVVVFKKFVWKRKQTMYE